jgi:GDP-L-fucose synthase
MNNKKILLTGGSGFIGKNILEQLGDKYIISAPPRNELDLTDELSVRAYFSKNNFDVVIHSATKPGHRNAPDPHNLLYSDTLMLMNLLACQNSFNHLIVLSSGAIYDERNYRSKMKEAELGKYIPVDEHGLFRYASARLFERLENVTELRIFGIFGKYEDYSIRFISNAICKTIFNLPITIKQNRKFDYLFIDDLMPVLSYFIENKGKFTAYNITPGHPHELFELAQIVKKISGKNLPITINKPGLGLEYTADNTRLLSEIKEIQFTPIEKAIKKLYDWYEKNKPLLKKECLLIDK